MYIELRQYHGRQTYINDGANVRSLEMSSL